MKPPRYLDGSSQKPHNDTFRLQCLHGTVWRPFGWMGPSIWRYVCLTTFSVSIRSHDALLPTGVTSDAECSELPSNLQAGCHWRWQWYVHNSSYACTSDTMLTLRNRT